jgi:hypothetical protein
MINSKATYLLISMKKCEECGRELNFYEGYRHPTLGKDFLLCSPCFDIVDENLAIWKEFVSTHIDLFNNGHSKTDYQLIKEKVISDYYQTKKKFDNVRFYCASSTN